MRKDREHEPTPEDEGPPTLPLPATWRLVVAAIAVAAVLWLMYETGREAEAPPSAPASSAIGRGTG